MPMDPETATQAEIHEILAEAVNFDFELDQRMQFAFNTAYKGYGGELTDAGIFVALLRTNPSFLRSILITPEIVEAAEEWARIYVGSRLYLVEAVRKAAERGLKDRSLGVGDFLSALLDYSESTGDDYENRPSTVDMLTHIFHGHDRLLLSQARETQKFLRAIRANAQEPEDFQFILGLEGEKIVFRVTSVLGDYAVRTDSGILVPQRAVLTHFKDQFGAFSEDEISELENLLNRQTSSEADFQRFFEVHTRFFRRWDYRDVFPHVTLVREGGALVPDFILTDRRLQRSAILDLKLPNKRIVRRQQNRDRFSGCVTEARAQLLRYRDWFRDRSNRIRLKKELGMEILEPQLIVVIGRSSEFVDELDRQRLRSDSADIEVATYDDILGYAEQRRMIIRA